MCLCFCDVVMHDLSCMIRINILRISPGASTNLTWSFYGSHLDLPGPQFPGRILIEFLVESKKQSIAILVDNSRILIKILVGILVESW